MAPLPLNALPGVTPPKPGSPAPSAQPVTPNAAGPAAPSTPANAAVPLPNSPGGESVASSDGEGSASPRTPSKVRHPGNDS